MNTRELDWLPPVGPTFRSAVKALRGNGDWNTADVTALSTQRLDFTGLQILARAMQSHPGFTSSERIRISILSNANLDFAASAIVATGPRFDLWLDLHVPPFGTFNQECLEPSSVTNQRRNDFVVLAIDHRGLALQPSIGDATRAEQMVADALAHLVRLIDALARDGRTAIVVQTLVPPLDALFGHLDRRVPGTLGWLVDRFNAGLREGRCGSALVLDAEALAARVGLECWHDPTQWHLGKFPFSLSMVPAYADAVCRLIAAARGKARKCLVLDLDNTLWGGVIGDDGMAGIRLGQGDPVGEAFLSVQAMALALRERGIVLAVSSKNDEVVARQVFREHPDMLLREDHIAVFQANWTDKAANLRAIAASLNIGLEALVFVDDNPAERAQVRRELPMVAVPELPDAPELFAATVMAAGYFEATQFTDDDRQRSAQYQMNAARSIALAGSTDVAGYLASLAMEAHFAPFDAVGLARITQLINKTNQFNLCTRRYGEAEVAALAADPAVFTLQIRLADAFGDNGMISVVICRTRERDWEIDSWLMSCRVLNRRVEEAVLDVLLRHARQRGIARVIGRYRPTARNAMVSGHYERLGFAPLGGSGDDALYAFEVSRDRPVDLPMRLNEERLGNVAPVADS